MRVILDTNVFVSGGFFAGPPNRILKAWRDGKLPLVVFQEILNDDKFLACGLISGCKVIVNGDRHLLKVSGFRGIKVVEPGQFITEYLSSGKGGASII